MVSVAVHSFHCPIISLNAISLLAFLPHISTHSTYAPSHSIIYHLKVGIPTTTPISPLNS